MKLAVFLCGGFLVWLGGYGYLKFKDSVLMRPTGKLETIFVTNGLLAEYLAVPFLIIGAYLFSWWISIVFLILAGISVGVLHNITEGRLTFFASLFGVPPGILIVISSFFIHE